MTTNYTQAEAEAFIKKISPLYRADWFHLVVIRLFIAMMNGDPEVPNLLVAMMPGLGKTELLSILLPAYVLSKDPTSHVLLLANNDLLAGVNSANLLRLVKTPEFREACPHSKLKETERDITFEAGDGRPNVHSASISGTVLGYRSTLTIGDDLVPSITASQPVINTIWLQWQGCAETRALPGAHQVIVGQRTGMTDIHSRVLERNRDLQAEQFAYFKLPATNNGEEAFIQYVGGRMEFFPAYKTPVTVKSQPYSFSPRAIAKKLRSMPKPMAAAMYMQSPQEVSELPFRTSEWPRVTQLYIDDIVRVYTSWDLSFGKTSQTNDFNANVVVGQTHAGYYLVLDAWHMRLEFPKLYPVVVERWRVLRDMFKLIPLLIVEDKASGSALLQTLAQEEPGIPLLPAKPSSRESKYERSLVVQPKTDAGHVAIYEQMPGKEWFEKEINEFPQEGQGFHDDGPDGFIHAMRAFINPKGLFKKPEDGVGIMTTRGAGQANQVEEFLEFMAEFKVGGKEDW
jgi:predicted phage terminase large subunit-like protein